MSAPKTAIRLLMVDDEPDFLEAITPGLERRGFHVTTAEDGRTALDLLTRETFDVVVLDVKMPGLDGISAFRRISEMVPQLPVIMLTGHGNIQDAFETSRGGAYDYLTKPCKVESLSETARRAHGERRLAEERARRAERERAERILTERPD